MRLQGKVALITGGATGIGRATALLFAREGAKVIVNTDRNKDAAMATVREILDNGGIATFAQGDVAVAGDAKSLIETTIENYQGIDILINNAAIGISKPLAATTEEEWRRVIDVNLNGVFLMCKYAIPEMIKRGGGVIINVSSAWGLVAGYNAAAYCASKAGVINLTRSIAIDYAKDNIRANAVCPGSIDTPILRHGIALAANPEAEERTIIEAHPIGRLGEPIEVAYAILLLACDEASFITGAPLLVDGGLLARCGQEGKGRWPIHS